MAGARRRTPPPRHRHRATRSGAPPSNPPGIHATAPAVAARLVRSAGVGPDDLVFDLGAGTGAVTVPLARTGARVIAVERDERLAARLRRATVPFPNVTVVTGDALRVPLPGRPFRVVANIPFSITTALLRRLVASRMVAADLIVEAGAGRRLAGPPDRREVARWQAAFRFQLGDTVPATCFRPVPPVDAVVLRLRRRAPSSRAPFSGGRSRRSGRGRR